MSSIALLNMANMKSANFIIKNVLDKNPGNIVGFTALHFAAQNGHFEICRIIIENPT